MITDLFLMIILLPSAFINQGDRIYLRDALSHQPVIICNSILDSVVTYQKNNGKKVKATISYQQTDQFIDNSDYLPTPYVQYEGIPEEFSLLLDKTASDYGWEDSIGSRAFVILLFDKKLRIKEIHIVSSLMYEEDVKKIATIVQKTEGHWSFAKRSKRKYNAVLFIKHFS